MPEPQNDGPLPPPSTEAKFTLGQTVATRAATAVLSPADILLALSRHSAGDWGDVDKGDWKANERALKHGERLLSVYHSPDSTKFYVITEWDRSVTTVLLPEDY